MVAIQPLVSEFTLVGRLEDFVIGSKGRIKYLSLSTSEDEYSIEVAKQTKTLQQYLQTGCQIKVSGMRKYKLHKEEVKYKAYRIELLEEAAIANNNTAKPNRKTKILVCQGSSCCKKGSNTLGKLLQKELAAKGVNGVEIKMTGCMKQCKQAPCIVMPGRNSYSRVQAKQVSGLVRANIASLQGNR